MVFLKTGWHVVLLSIYLIFSQVLCYTHTLISQLLPIIKNGYKHQGKRSWQWAYHIFRIANFSTRTWRNAWLYCCGPTSGRCWWAIRGLLWSFKGGYTGGIKNEGEMLEGWRMERKRGRTGSGKQFCRWTNGRSPKTATIYTRWRNFSLAIESELSLLICTSM